MLAEHDISSAAAAAIKFYERLPFLSAAAAHVDAEALNLWKLSGLSARYYVDVMFCFIGNFIKAAMLTLLLSFLLLMMVFDDVLRL